MLLSLPEYTQKLRNDLRLAGIRNQSLARAHTHQKQKSDKLQEENNRLKKENEKLRKENGKLKQEIEQLTKQIAGIRYLFLIMGTLLIREKKIRNKKVDRKDIVTPIGKAMKVMHRTDINEYLQKFVGSVVVL